MYCPKCRSEYRKGFTRCSECGCPLVERLSADPVTDQREHAEPRFLCEAANDFEAEIILSKLKAEGIFAFKRYRGSDSYNKILLGRAILGVEILVSEADFEEAQNIVLERGIPVEDESE